MNGLQHTDLKSWVRGLPMSEHTLFIVVEGKTVDRYFYGKLAKCVCQVHHVSHLTLLPREIPGEGGQEKYVGKPGLIKIHEALERLGVLKSTLGGKKTVIAFFVDKDIDDFIRGGRRVQSPHFIYTKFYDAEAHIFANGDLIGCTAASASLDETDVARGVGDPSEWLRACAEQWIDWIKLCIICERYKAKGVGNYGHESTVNFCTFGPADPKQLHNRLVDAQRAACVDQATFARVHQIVSNLVDRLFQEGRFCEVFKGKWYVNFMDHCLMQNGLEFDRQGLHAGLVGAMSSKLDPAEPWAEYFVSRLENVLN